MYSSFVRIVLVIASLNLCECVIIARTDDRDDIIVQFNGYPMRSNTAMNIPVPSYINFATNRLSLLRARPIGLSGLSIASLPPPYYVELPITHWGRLAEVIVTVDSINEPVPDINIDNGAGTSSRTPLPTTTSTTTVVASTISSSTTEATPSSTTEAPLSSTADQTSTTDQTSSSATIPST